MTSVISKANSTTYPFDRLKVRGNGGYPTRRPFSTKKEKKEGHAHHGLRSALRKQPASFSVALSQTAKAPKPELYGDPIDIERLADLWATHGDWTSLANSAMSNYVLQGTRVNDNKPMSNFEKSLMAKARRCQSEPMKEVEYTDKTETRNQSAKSIKSDDIVLPALGNSVPTTRESKRSNSSKPGLELFGRHLATYGKDLDDEDQIDMSYYVAQYQLPDTFRPYKKLRFCHTLETPRDLRADKTQLRSCLKVEAQTREIPRDDIKMKHFTQYVRTTNTPRVKFGMMPANVVQRINNSKSEPKYAFVSVESYLNYPKRHTVPFPEERLLDDRVGRSHLMQSVYDWNPSPKSRKSSAYSDIAVHKDLEGYFQIRNKSMATRANENGRRSQRSVSHAKTATTMVEDLEETWAANELLMECKDVSSQNMEVDKR